MGTFNGVVVELVMEVRGSRAWGQQSTWCVFCGMLRWNYDIRHAFYVIKYDDAKCLRSCGTELCHRVRSWLQ